MFDRARAILRAGIVEHVFPAAVAEVGDGTRVLWREAFGRLTYDDSGPDAAPATSADTIFDLASLTKVMATTPMAIQLVERGALALDDCVRDRLPGWTSPDRREVTVRDLLSHSSGLPGHQPLFQDQTGRVRFERAICAASLEFVPRTASVYSDLGFMLLGFILEDAGGVRLDQHFDTLMAQMRITDRVQFTPPRRWASDTAPTGLDAWRGQRPERMGARWRGWTRRPFWYGRLGWRLCPPPAAGAGRSHGGGVPVGAPGIYRSPRRHPWELARTRLGHDAADILVRFADVPSRLRSHGLYGHLALDRP